NDSPDCSTWVSQIGTSTWTGGRQASSSGSIDASSSAITSRSIDSASSATAVTTSRQLFAHALPVATPGSTSTIPSDNGSSERITVTEYRASSSPYSNVKSAAK